MLLKPQDLLVLLKIIAGRGRRWTYSALAGELGMSAAEVHAGVRRSVQAGLARPGEHGGPGRPLRRAVEEFVLYGVPHVFIAEQGGLTRGIATAGAAPMLEALHEASEPPLVWPHPEGRIRGQALSPLYRSAPEAALRDPVLHELLALVDLLRIGGTRVRNIVREPLRRSLGLYRLNTGIS